MSKTGLRPPICCTVSGKDFLGLCSGLWLLWKALSVFCLWGAHGNAGTWVTISPLVIPAPAHTSTPVIHPKEPHAGADQEATPDLEGCPPLVVMLPPAAAPATALDPGPACAGSPDLPEVPPPLPEDPSLQPGLCLARDTDLIWKINESQL